MKYNDKSVDSCDSRDSCDSSHGSAVMIVMR